MYTLTQKLADLVPYEPIKGEYKIRLDANESCFNLPPEITNKITTALSQLDFNRYPDPYAVKTIESFSGYYRINPKLVTAGNGSDELISLLCGCFLQKDDTIVTLSHDFSMYAFYASLCELNVKTFDKNDDLTIDIAKLIEFCKTTNAKLLIFSNPCNPTSLGIEKTEMLQIVAELEKIGCLVAADEAYMDFWGKKAEQSVLGCVTEHENLLVLKTASKFVGLAAIRLGFAVANEKITRALKAAKSPYNTDSISQLVGEIVFKEHDYLYQRKMELLDNTAVLYYKLASFSDRGTFEKVYPTKANFVFVKTDKATEIADLLAENGIAVRNFKTHLRICTGAKEELAELFRVLDNFK
jgi:histidinol-phosphate aminotransferase